MFMKPESPVAKAASDAIRAGNIHDLKEILAANLSLVTTYIGDESEGRTLLHILTDWPGRFPNGRAIAETLITAGANVDAPFIGKHSETALHWAASCNDVGVLDILLDSGANIDAPGGVIADTPLADARAFLQWEAAHRLVERGAKVTLHDAATLGLLDRVQAFCDSIPAPSTVDMNNALWNACHGGQLAVVQYLYAKGADTRAVPQWENLTPIEAARRSNAKDVVEWLQHIANR